MAGIDDVKDQASIESWLNTRSPADSIIMAYRGALRVLPLWGREMKKSWSLEADMTTLSVVHSLMAGMFARTYLTTMDTAFVASLTSTSVVSHASALHDAAHVAALAAISAAAAAASLTPSSFAASSIAAAAAAALRAGFASAYAMAPQASGFAVASFRNEIENDVAALEQGDDLFTEPLWMAVQPDWFNKADAEMRAIWAADPPAHWAFWTRWWDGVLAGKPPNWDVQHDIALIPDEVWKAGPGPVAEAIAAIEAEHAKQTQTPHDLDTELARLPAASQQSIQTIKVALTTNRDALPPTFDAIQGYIALEITRLKTKNYKGDDEQAEALRQIGVLTILQSAIARMQTLVPDHGDVTDATAEKVESVFRLYQRKFAEWPRVNADELVDNTYRGAIIGGTIAVCTYFSVGLAVPVAAACLLFGGKKVEDAVKGAKDLVTLVKPAP